jgi:hypothetical protein
VTRVLDIDLDFFLDAVATWIPKDGPRLDPSDYHPWSEDNVLSFLSDRCLLSGRTPGFVVEHHDEVFPLWREALNQGILSTPFHVTHVDAHADLGMGDTGYVYLLGELLFAPVEERRNPTLGDGGMDFGNWLLFALANRWIADLTLVYCDGGGSDVFSWHMEDFDHSASNLQLKAINASDIKKWVGHGNPPVQSLEPPVPFRQCRWDSFQAGAPYDLVCLSRSPSYTPETSDDLFELIRNRFIDPLSLAS